MSLPTKRIHFGDYSFDILENVYEPAEDSFLFVENLEVETNSRVLDVGTGCGILGILAAKNAYSVIATDINPFAICCAKENSNLNNVRNKMNIVRSDLLTAFDEKPKFDLIIFNAPYLPTVESESGNWLSRSWAGGIDGRQVIDRFISQAAHFLHKDGRILLMQSTLSNVEETIRKFRNQDLKTRIKSECKLPFFESIILLEAKS